METWAQHISNSELTYFAQLPWSTIVTRPQLASQCGSLPSCHRAIYPYIRCCAISNYGTMIIRTVSVTEARFDDEPAITTIGSPDFAYPVSFNWVTA